MRGACTSPLALLTAWHQSDHPPFIVPVLTGGRLEDINKSCLEQFRAHWDCLDNNNHQLWQCRPAEWKLNKCVFENLVRYLSTLFAVTSPGPLS